MSSSTETTELYTNLQNMKVFIFWDGPKCPFIIKLFQYIAKHHLGDRLIILNDTNIHLYLDDIHPRAIKLDYHHKTDYYRVCLLEKHGGIWIDSDVLVLNNFEKLFELMKDTEGFFVTEHPFDYHKRIQCFIGSRAGTNFYKNWKKYIVDLFDSHIKLEWTSLGSTYLDTVLRNSPEEYDSYKIIDGPSTVYPIYYAFQIKELLHSHETNCEKIINLNQPAIIFFNSIYYHITNKYNPENFITCKTPLNSLINNSFKNMTDLIDYDFIEIGTSDFNTVIENATDETIGLSIEPIKYYIDKLPDKKNVKKLNVAISDRDGNIDIYYIPEHVITEHNLQYWLKGCNSVNKKHKHHENFDSLVEKETVPVVDIVTLFISQRVRGIKYLKIDVEGHDCVILNSMYNYIKLMPKIFFPKQIIFQSREHTDPIDIYDIYDKFTSIGYAIKNTEWNTIMTYE